MGEKNLTRVLIALAHEFNSLFLNDLKCPVRFGFYKKKKEKKDFRRKKGYLYWDLQGLKKKEKKKEIDCYSCIVLYSKKACTCTNTCTLYLKSVGTLSVLLKTCFYSIILIYYD